MSLRLTPILGFVKDTLSLSIGMSHRKGVPQSEALSVFACLTPRRIVRIPSTERGRTEPRENAASLRAINGKAIGHALTARREDHEASLAASVGRMSPWPRPHCPQGESSTDKFGLWAFPRDADCLCSLGESVWVRCSPRPADAARHAAACTRMATRTVGSQQVGVPRRLAPG